VSIYCRPPDVETCDRWLTDAEGWKCGAQTGLEARVVHTLNDEFLILNLEAEVIYVIFQGISFKNHINSIDNTVGFCWITRNNFILFLLNGNTDKAGMSKWLHEQMAEMFLNGIKVNAKILRLGSTAAGWNSKELTETCIRGGAVV